MESAAVAKGASLREPENDAATMCDAFQASVARYGDRLALRTPGGATELTWAECAERVRRLAEGLAGLGVRSGDSVALLLSNRPEFNLLDTAAIHLGATPWSIYATSAPEQISFLLASAGSRVVITEATFSDRVAGALPGTDVESVVLVEELDRLPEPPRGFDFDATWRAVEPENVLTLIWTSGTTGEPKGVELTHRAMAAALDGLNSIVDPSPGGRATSYLPAAHVADRWSAHYWWMMLGLTVTCVADGRRIIEVLPEVRPTIWGSVPRVWEKLQAALEAGGVTAPGSLSEDQRAAIRTRLGLDQVEWLVVGAAPLAVATLRFFADLGLPLSEVWGMSETCGLLTVNPPEDRRFGTVGQALPGTELRLAADGEVLARGPQLMRGYRGRPELTAETIDSDGWLHTGDVGRFGEDGYLTIIDRKKELIINAAGKNMSPLAIEAALKSSGPLIGQACVIGDRRSFNAALLILDPDTAHAWAAAHAREHSSYAELARDPQVLAAVGAEVERANARLSRVEQIKAWRLLESDWEPDGEELTATMKLKRKPIATKYAAVIEELYAS